MTKEKREVGKALNKLSIVITARSSMGMIPLPTL